MSRIAISISRPLLWAIAFSLLFSASLAAIVYARQSEQINEVFAIGAGFFLMATLSQLSQFWEQKRRASTVIVVPNSSLTVGIVARHISVDCSLRELSVEESKYEEGRDLIWVDYLLEYRLHNRSQTNETLPLPLFPVSNLGGARRSEVLIHRVVMGGLELDHAQIEASRRPYGHNGSSHQFMAHLKSGEDLVVKVQARTKRERSDSEVWSFPFLVEEGIRFRLSAPPDFRYGFQSLARDDISIVAQGPTFEMAMIEGPLPPFNSVVAWWRIQDDPLV